METLLTCLALLLNKFNKKIILFKLKKILIDSKIQKTENTF
jgi:hypothetical protein